MIPRSTSVVPPWIVNFGAVFIAKSSCSSKVAWFDASASTKAASSVAEKYGIPMIASTASSVEVYDQGYKSLFGVFTANDTLTDPWPCWASTAGPDSTIAA